MQRAVLAMALLVALVPRDASACTCQVPPPRLVTPARGDGAPLNTKVRYSISPAWTKPTERVELRTLHDNEVVPTTEARTTLGSLDIVELTPKAPLQVNTRYALARVRTEDRPRTIVFGSFRTGTALDQKPPVLSPLGPVQTHSGQGSPHSTCDTGHAYATVGRVRAKDPDRANAKLIYGVWIADKTGRVNTKNPPTGLLELGNIVGLPDDLSIGNDDLCDMRKFPFPAQRNVTLGIAALDEAGNASGVRMLSLRFSQVPPAAVP